MKLLILLFPFVLIGSTDDGWMGSRGGSVFPIIRNENISMVNEEILIDIDSCYKDVKVSCKFWFKNLSKKPQEGIYMGFPDSYDNDPHSVGGASPIENFTCQLNGVKANVKKQVQTYEQTDTAKIFYPAWYCWYANFKPEETILIENKYSGMLGGDNGGDFFYSYILGTANTWHGSIGQGKIVFRYSKMIPTYSCEAEDEHYDENNLKDIISNGMSLTTYQDSSVFIFNNYHPTLREEVGVTFSRKTENNAAQHGIK